MTKDNSDVQNIQESKGSSKVIAKSNQFGDLQDLEFNDREKPEYDSSWKAGSVKKDFMIDLKEFSKIFAL